MVSLTQRPTPITLYHKSNAPSSVRHPSPALICTIVCHQPLSSINHRYYSNSQYHSQELSLQHQRTIINQTSMSSVKHQAKQSYHINVASLSCASSISHNLPSFLLSMIHHIIITLNIHPSIILVSCFTHSHNQTRYISLACSAIPPLSLSYHIIAKSLVIRRHHHQWYSTSFNATQSQQQLQWERSVIQSYIYHYIQSVLFI
jgi:hypothetical protein